MVMSRATTRSSTPKLPVAQLVILSICRFAEPVALTGVFPYLPEMIESFNIPHAEVGNWAGITSAVFSIAQCLTAIPWGRASDRFGRKPVILIALTCAMASSLMFGFSKSLTWAIIARAFAGASNGNTGILRTTVAEMVPQKSLQPKAFATLPLVYQLGGIVGPILGGALASPARKFPKLFGKNRFFVEFPYALPNLVASVPFTFGLLTGVLFLKESLERKKYRRDYGRIIGEWMTAPCYRSKKSLRPIDDFESVMPKKNDHTAEQVPPARYRDILLPQSNLVLLAYTILAMHSVTYNQIIAVFLHQAVSEDRSQDKLPFKFGGGFGLESGRIGTIFMVIGIVSMTCQFTIFPSWTSRFGALSCFRIVCLVCPIAYLVTPYTVLLPSTISRQLAILGVSLLKALADVFAYPCVIILLTNSAKSVHTLGTLNGIATSVSAIGRGVGPFLAGKTFTWGVDYGYNIAAWWLLAVFAILGYIVTLWLVETQGFGDDENESKTHEVREGFNLETTTVALPLLVDDDATNIIIADDSDDNSDDDSGIEMAPLLTEHFKKESDP